MNELAQAIGIALSKDGTTMLEKIKHEADEDDDKANE